MKVEALIKMANQITAFFEAESGEQDAPAMIASHLRRFWEPRMRREIIAYCETDGSGLDELALRAVKLLAAERPAGAADAAARPN